MVKGAKLCPTIQAAVFCSLHDPTHGRNGLQLSVWNAESSSGVYTRSECVQQHLAEPEDSLPALFRYRYKYPVHPEMTNKWLS